MKKLLSLILVIVFAMAANSQVVMTQTDPAGAAATVNTNGDTSYHKVDLAGQTFNYQYVTITVAGTKTSGTVAGTVTLWGSNDNSRWFAAYGSSTAALSDTVTTQNLTDADNNLQFLVTGTRYRYYRVRVITTGTQVSSYVCRLLGRKVPN